MSDGRSDDSDDDDYDESNDSGQQFTPRGDKSSIFSLLEENEDDATSSNDHSPADSSTDLKNQETETRPPLPPKPLANLSHTLIKELNLSGSNSETRSAGSEDESLSTETTSPLTQLPVHRKHSKRAGGKRRSELCSPPQDYLILRLNPILEGFLIFKRRRRWVILDDDNLYVFKSAEDFGEPMEKIGLHCSAVRKQDKDREKEGPSFEIITSGQTYLFVVDKDDRMHDKFFTLESWVANIRAVCDNLVLNTIGGGSEKDNILSKSYSKLLAKDDVVAAKELNFTEGSREAMQIAVLEGNRICADCGSKNPDWASINLGIFICIKCSGIHRSFGTHISKVRSVKLDKWEPSWVDKMRSVGNNHFNKIWQANVPPEIGPLDENSDLGYRKQWLTLKYIEERFKADWKPKISANTTSITSPSLDVKQFSQDFRAQFKSFLLLTLKEDPEFLQEMRKLINPGDEKCLSGAIENDCV